MPKNNFGGRAWVVLIAAIVAATVSACNKNAFTESAKKDTDAALLFEARKQMNTLSWSDAITLINKMSAGGLAARSTKAALASAYAGRCGLNLIRMADKISTAGTTPIFAVLLSTLKGATVSSIADCQLAETTLNSISASAASRSADENVMMAFIGFAKIGAVLALYGDTNADGTVDPTFDSCSVAQLPDAMLREVGTGLTIAVASLSASGGSVGAALAASVNAACVQAAAIDPTFDFCAVQIASAFSVNQVKVLGGLVKSTDSPGLGTCAGSLATCVCP